MIVDRLIVLACRLKGEGNIGTLGEWSYLNRFTLAYAITQSMERA